MGEGSGARFLLLVLGGTATGLGVVYAYRSIKGANARTMAPSPPRAALPSPPPQPIAVSPVTVTITPAYARGPSLDAEVDMANPMVRQWFGVTRAIMPAFKVPPEFADAWIGIESNGNACAVGMPESVGPDGYPREVGIFQMYNPNDFAAIGASPAELCAYCVRPELGEKKQRQADGGYTDGTKKNPQQLAGAMSGAQMGRQVELGAKMIVTKRAFAEKYLHASSVTWADTTPDFWAAVKAAHGWPPILHASIPLVTRHLGRAPVSWTEFRATLEEIDPAARYNPALPTWRQQPLFRGLRNAEWTGFKVNAAPLPAVPRAPAPPAPPPVPVAELELAIPPIAITELVNYEFDVDRALAAFGGYPGYQGKNHWHDFPKALETAMTLPEHWAIFQRLKRDATQTTDIKKRQAATDTLYRISTEAKNPANKELAFTILRDLSPHFRPPQTA